MKRFQIGDRVTHVEGRSGVITDVFTHWTVLFNGKKINRRKIVYVVQFDGSKSGYAISHQSRKLQLEKVEV